MILVDQLYKEQRVYWFLFSLPLWLLVPLWFAAAIYTQNAVYLGKLTTTLWGFFNAVFMLGFSLPHIWEIFITFSGAYDDEEAAAHAYDLAALKYWGQDTILNFPVILSLTVLFIFMSTSFLLGRLRKKLV